MDDLLKDLTPAQAEAVQHTEGPLLILAGAGSGKTRVITRRVAYLLRSGVKPWNILAITFTNKAAGEMRHRVEAIVPGSKVWVSTFHSLGARLLRQYGDRVGIDRNFTIYDVDDRNKLVKEALNIADLDDVKFTPDRIAAAISKAKNQLQPPPAYEREASDYFTQTVAKVYHIYEKRLRAANAMDFDDLLYLPALALRHNEELRRDLDERFRYLLIDEYQDTNSAQYEIAKRLSLTHPNLCVVGDPDQSIYKWRGSDLRNILDFERDFPAAKVITLSQNYRSTKAILKAASALIDHNQERKKKTLETANPEGEPVEVVTYDNGLDEAEGIVERIKAKVADGQCRYRDCAVFVRINALTRSLESAFVKHGVPFQIVKGLAFFDRKENKDVLAYLRLLVNPQDSVGFLRIVNEPARGIGKTSLDRLQAYALNNEIGLLAAAGQVAKIPEIKGKAAAGLRDFHKMITELRMFLEMPPHEIIRLVLEKTGYRQMLADTEDGENDRVANIEEMITAAKQFYDEDMERTLSDFLENVALASDVDSFDEEQDRVSVMTLHSAKGLEFPVVHLMAVEQGLLPHERSLGRREDLEEERRLCFVGMTRAMKHLTLTNARSREFRGQILYAIPSLFLDELPSDVQRHNSSSRYNAAQQYRVSDPGSFIPEPPKKFVPQMPQNNPEELDIGMVVQHEQYGFGKITDLSGLGSLRKMRIRFAAAGEKTFVASKVKLRVVKRG